MKTTAQRLKGKKPNVKEVDSRPYRNTDVDLMLWQFGSGLLAVANSGKYSGDAEALNLLAEIKAIQLRDSFGEKASNGRNLINPAPSFLLKFQHVSDNHGARFTIKKVLL